jgi:hypothetical protein
MTWSPGDLGNLLMAIKPDVRRQDDLFAFLVGDRRAVIIEQLNGRDLRVDASSWPRFAGRHVNV